MLQLAKSCKRPAEMFNFEFHVMLTNSVQEKGNSFFLKESIIKMKTSRKYCRKWQIVDLATKISYFVYLKTDLPAFQNALDFAWPKCW